MDIITETQTAILNKSASLHRKEREWRGKQGGQLEGWQIVKLENGIKDVRQLQNLVATIEALRSANVERPMTFREAVLIKFGYTEKDILLRRLVHLIDNVVEQKAPGSPLSITVEKKYFLGILREISERYKALNNAKPN